jgi:uncharacterized phage-associated protein
MPAGGDRKNYCAVEGRERGEILTNLKLQKLLYYAQAWYLALNDRPLFDEDFQAWIHGPVLPSQYHRFKEFQWRPITIDVDVSRLPRLDARLKEHLDEIMDVFCIESAVALELMTHQEMPWIEARGGISRDEPSNATINKATMRDFYRTLGNQKN